MTDCSRFEPVRAAPVTAMLRPLVVGLALAIGACASQGGVDARSSPVALLDEPGLAGMRWGLLAVAEDGEVVAEVRADDRFSPASNTKIFITASAFARLHDLEASDPEDGTSVWLEAQEGGVPDVVLVGAGDPMLGDGPGCAQSCLAELADAVAARTHRVDEVIGDDRLYPDERWAPGWSWEDLQTSFGTAASALTVNENVVWADVTPGDGVGDPLRVTWREGDDLLTIDSQAITVAEGQGDLRLERPPGSAVVRLYGGLALGSAPVPLRIAVDDPAEAAAVRFRRLLEQRGVTVVGEARARHRPLDLSDDPATRIDPADRIGPLGERVARLIRRPLTLSLLRISKSSQNLHAELLLRRLGSIEGTGSRAYGLAVVEAVMAGAGVSRAAWDLQDGSGMSVYNRVSPRATTTFLRWTQTQPWGEAWRATLPIGGRDGTLARRFVGTPLEGRIFAKTGSLNGVNALAGFLTSASGRTIVFAVYANDRPSMAGSATEVMDRMLVALAAAN